MTKKSKEVAEYFALGAINLSQVLELIPEEENLREVLEYAEDYGAQYDLWCMIQKEKHQQMEEDWEAYEQKYFLDTDEIFAMLDAMEIEQFRTDFAKFAIEDSIPKYSDADLQAAFDKENRRAQIKNAAIEARNKGISYKVMHKFCGDYKLTNAEITWFWVNYYFPDTE